MSTDRPRACEMGEVMDTAESHGHEPRAVAIANRQLSYSKVETRKRSPRQRRLLYCCGTCSAITIVLMVILIILIFTVFKQKDPKIHVDSLTLEGLTVNVGNVFTNPNLAVDLDLLTQLSVKNPNYASFNYRNTTAFIYYQGIVVADSTVPPGKVKSRSSAQLNSTTSVHITGSIINAQLLTDVNAGVLPIVTTVRLQGTAKVLGFLSVKNVRTSAKCDVLIYIANQTQSFHCDYRVKL